MNGRYPAEGRIPQTAEKPASGLGRKRVFAICNMIWIVFTDPGFPLRVKSLPGFSAFCSAPLASLDFLLQRKEYVRIEEVLNRDPQSIAELLDRCNGSAVISSADDIVHGGLCNTAHIGKLVNGNAMLTTQFNDPLPNGLTNCNGYHFLLQKDTHLHLKRLTLLS